MIIKFDTTSQNHLIKGWEEGSPHNAWRCQSVTSTLTSAPLTRTCNSSGSKALNHVASMTALRPFKKAHKAAGSRSVYDGLRVDVPRSCLLVTFVSVSDRVYLCRLP